MPRWIRATIVLVLIGISAGAISYGLRLRHDVWFETSGVHFEGDVGNAFHWGRLADRNRLFHVYETVLKSPFGTSLDYTPLRLTVAMAWAHWANLRYPDVKVWNDDYDLTLPMLRLNTLAELLSSLFIFLLIRMWVIRMDDARRARSLDSNPPREFRGVLQGMIGALFFWFNPAIVWDGHCWPQWDIWLVPFFLAALLLACVDWWFAAGVCLTIGAMLKGQMLLGAPILLLWPICQFRFGAVLRLLAGLALSAATIIFPWLLLSTSAFVWFVLVLVSMGFMMPIALRWELPAKLQWSVLATCMVAAMLLAWPWTSEASIEWRLVPVVMVGILALVRFLPASLLPHVYALMVAIAAFLLIPLHGANTAWYDIGFAGGAEKYHGMLSGTGVFNLPALLRATLRWPISIDDPTTLPLINQVVTFRTAMVIVYAICLLLCAIGAAIHYRRRDVRFLVAMAAPWVIFYCLLTQMHGRYLVWGAAMSALLVGAGWGLSLLGLLVSLLATLNIVFNQYTFVPDWDPQHFQLIRPLVPHVGWMLLLLAAIYLYYALVPRTRLTVT